MKTNKRFAKEYGIGFPLISDSDKKIRRLYGGGRITYLIDKKGVIRFIQKGVPDNNLFLKELKRLRDVNIPIQERGSRTDSSALQRAAGNALALPFNGSIQREVTSDMEDATVNRISAQQAKEMVEAGSGLLVCAYDDEDKFKRNHLSGAISLAEFRSRLTSIPRDREIVFYCA